MNLPVRKKLPHAVPQRVPDGSWFFITIKCAPPGKNQLGRVDIGTAVIAALAYNHDNLIWHCRLALLMPDHLHAIFAFPPAADSDEGGQVFRFKSEYASSARNENGGKELEEVCR